MRNTEIKMSIFDKTHRRKEGKTYGDIKYRKHDVVIQPHQAKIMLQPF